MSKEEILNLEFESRDLGETVTVRGFFIAILLTLWEEGEAFSGKRPLGNSGWDGDLIELMVKHKLIKGEMNGDGYVDDYDRFAFDDLIKSLIESL